MNKKLNIFLFREESLKERSVRVTPKFKREVTKLKEKKVREELIFYYSIKHNFLFPLCGREVTIILLVYVVYPVFNLWSEFTQKLAS